MKKSTLIFLLIFLISVLLPAAVASAQQQSADELPFYFIKNMGQINTDIGYHLKLPHGNVFFDRNIITYQFIANGRVENIRLNFIGADTDAKPVGRNKSTALFNFYSDNDPNNWFPGVPSFGRIVYRSLYPNIDLIVISTNGMVKHEYRVHPGGSQDDDASGLAVDTFGSVYITGTTSSLDFPTTPASYSPARQGCEDAFVARIRDTGLVEISSKDTVDSPRIITITLNIK